jgi:tRNA threonylcarbamoyladenosine biosynthesis protein TsaB
MIQQILREAGVGFGDLKGVAVTTGPGSFTGLRIGLAAAHGIALAQTIPAVGISSFRAFREAAPNNHRDYYVIIESRRAELYWQVFDDYSGPISDPTYNTAEEIAEMARDKEKEILILGDGCAHLRHLLPNYQFLDQSPGPSPLVVAQLGATDIIYSPPSGLPQPVYIRPADAKPAKA